MDDPTIVHWTYKFNEEAINAALIKAGIKVTGRDPRGFTSEDLESEATPLQPSQS